MSVYGPLFNTLFYFQDPVFNTSLIVGYYWIPLTVLLILYGFIFQAAWVLGNKSKVIMFRVPLFEGY